jgi:hypothetical protein
MDICPLNRPWTVLGWHFGQKIKFLMFSGTKARCWAAFFERTSQL